MKKWMAILLTLAICLGLAACGEEPVATTEPTASKYSRFTEYDIYLAVIKMTEEDFYEPSAVRVMGVYDFDDRTSWEKYEDSNDEEERSLYEHNYGPALVTVRLQGENRVGGTVNHYYRVSISDDINFSDYGWERYSDCIAQGNLVEAMNYFGLVGKYVDCGDDYKPEKYEDFDIGRINRLLKEYWDEMGF